MRGILVLGLLSLLACESNDDRPDSGRDVGTDAGADGGNDAGNDAATDSGTDGGSLDSGLDGGLQTVPILERTPDLSYECSGRLPVTRPPNRSWNGNGWTFGLTASNGATSFGRIEREGDPIGIPTNVRALISTLSSDGTYGTPLEIAIPSVDNVDSVALASINYDVLFAYTDADGAQLARIVNGNFVDGPKTVLAVGGDPIRVKIATKSDRGAVLYGVAGLDNRVSYLLQPIDTGGAPVGASYEVVRSARAYLDPGASIVPTATGWAVAWRDAVTQAGEIYVRLFNDDATPAGDTKIVFSASGEQRAGYSVGFEASSIALHPLASGELLVGYVESLNDPNGTGTSGAWAMVAIAKLDAEGDLIGERALLRSPELEFDHVEPELFAYGNAVGLAWGRGEHIYICAGCVPSHSLRLVLIDPARMIPVSEVAEIDDATGGILYRSTVVEGSDIISAFRLVYHVSSEGGVASFTCDPL